MFSVVSTSTPGNNSDTILSTTALIASHLAVASLTLFSSLDVPSSEPNLVPTRLVVEPAYLANLTIVKPFDFTVLIAS